jgi:hypothetical protein
MVNVCGFARRFDFKRVFEDLPSPPDRNLAAIGLTQADTMLINCALKRMGALPQTGESRADFCFADPRKKAHRRGWMIPPANVAVRDQGPSRALFYCLDLLSECRKSGANND